MQDIQVTEWLEHQLGTHHFFFLTVLFLLPSFTSSHVNSAETVAGMILADKFNETFAIPEWLPRVYVPNVESWDSLVEPKKRGWAFGCTAV